MVVTDTVTRLKDAFRGFGAPAIPRRIDPPVAFHYLDSASIEVIYSQIQPELEEKERTVGVSKAIRGEGKAGSVVRVLAGRPGRPKTHKLDLSGSPFPQIENV
jgi:hypothetical protein